MTDTTTPADEREGKPQLPGWALSLTESKLKDLFAWRDACAAWQARAAIQPAQKPVAWLYGPHNELLHPHEVEEAAYEKDPYLYTPLYAATPADTARQPAQEPVDVTRDPRVLLAACLLNPLPLSLANAIKEVLAAPPADTARQDRIMEKARTWSHYTELWARGSIGIASVDFAAAALEAEVRKPA
jgi:hypothetical protein